MLCCSVRMDICTILQFLKIAYVTPWGFTFYDFLNVSQTSFRTDPKYFVNFNRWKDLFFYHIFLNWSLVQRIKAFHIMSLQFLLGPFCSKWHLKTLELKEKETWVQTQVLWIQMPIISSTPSMPGKLLECVWMADGKAAGTFLWPPEWGSGWQVPEELYVPTLSAVSHRLVCSAPGVLDLPLRSQPARHGTKPGSSLVNAEMRSFKG